MFDSFCTVWFILIVKYSAWLIFIPNASEREREQSGITSSCHCMWTYLADLRASGGSFHEHINPFYDRERYWLPLVPPAAALAPTLWPQFYLRWTCPPESQGGGLESHGHSMRKKYEASVKVLFYSLLLFIMQALLYFFSTYNT